MDDRLTTGLEALDRQLASDSGKGVPEGSLIVMEVPPGFQYEPLVWSFMDYHPTVYAVTLRTEVAIRDDLEMVAPLEEYEVRDVGFDTPVRDTAKVIELIDRTANVVVDTVNPLETVGDDDERYLKFLNDFKNHLMNTASLGMLIATTDGDPGRGREHSLTVADMVWELECHVRGGAVENHLRIKKFRGGRVPEETIKLQLGRQVEVDTSRDIA